MNQDVFLMHFEGRLCFIFRIHCLAVYGPAIFYSPKVSDFCVDRFVATRGKLRVSEVCSNKLKFSPL